MRRPTEACLGEALVLVPALPTAGTTVPAGLSAAGIPTARVGDDRP
jgi:hypothetical protein